VGEHEFSRLERVASTVQKILAVPIGELARTRAVGLVTITAVDLSPDLKRGVVYLSIYGDATDKGEFLNLLSRNAHELQSTLARSLRTKRTPVLSFRIDDAIERSDRINRLLRPVGGNTGKGVLR
jgi:ribosome-binding factor A